MSERVEFFTIKNSVMSQPLVQILSNYFRNNDVDAVRNYFQDINVDVKGLGYIYTLSFLEYMVNYDTSFQDLDNDFGLSSMRTQEHIDTLVNNGLVINENNKYVVTQKGECFWNIIEKNIIKDIVKSFYNKFLE